jgi:hypothetical protein
MTMRSAVTLEREKKITITRTRQSIPLSSEITDRRPINRRSRSDETIIFLRGGISIGKIIPIRRVGIQSLDQGIIGK